MPASSMVTMGTTSNDNSIHIEGIDSYKELALMNDRWVRHHG